MNSYELLTAVFIDSYPVRYNEGSYESLIESMREHGAAFYKDCQVEGASADGAYIKSNVQSYFSN